MHHFSTDRIVGPTEFRRHLGKYLKVSEHEPVLILDRGKQKKILIDVQLLAGFSFVSAPSQPQKSLDRMVGLFGKARASSVQLQKSIKKSWYQKHS